MELMWGIQHLMHRLLPEEKAEVARGPPPHEARTKNVPETLWI